jgi:hypothetical protein
MTSPEILVFPARVMAEPEVPWDLNIETVEATLQTGAFTTWYQVWGKGPIKALFLHGGPGNCVGS